MREILAYLDLDSVLELFATFDASISRFMASPGAFQYLRLPPINFRTYGKLKYLLKHIRNVSHLRIDKEVAWSPMTLGLLSTLNPLSLSLGSGFLHESSYKLLQDYIAQPDNPQLSSLAKNLCWDITPNLALLTPRLTSLEMPHPDDLKISGELDSELIKDNSLLPSHFTTPSSLTRLTWTVSSVFYRPVVHNITEYFPSTLKSIEINIENIRVHVPGEIMTTQLFPYFKELETLSMTNVAYFSIPALVYGDDPATAVPTSSMEEIANSPNSGWYFPASLHSLHLHLEAFPNALLAGRTLSKTAITTIILSCKRFMAERAFSFSELLPSTITHLGLDIKCSLPSTKTLLHLPLSLTVLRLKIDSVSEMTSLLSSSSFGDMSSLMDLSLDCSDQKSACSIELLPLDSLPRSLTSLGLLGFIGHRFVKPTSLPSSLTKFTTSIFSHALIKPFRDYLPACVLDVQWKRNREMKGEMPLLRELFLPPPPLLDMSALGHRMMEYYEAHRLPFFDAVATELFRGNHYTELRIDSLGPKEIPLHNYMQFIDFWECFPALTKLVIDVPQEVDETPLDELFPIFNRLEYLEIGANCKVLFDFSELPPHLTHLSVESGNDLTFSPPNPAWVPPKLRVFYAPSFTIPKSFMPFINLTHIKDLKIANPPIASRS